MMKMVLAAAVVAAVFAPDASLADDANGRAMPARDMMATMVCRSARADEKPTAMMMGQRTALVCKSVAEVMKARTMGPDTSKALSSQQADEAWQSWIASVLAVPVTPP
jgi:hypothetical protein